LLQLIYTVQQLTSVLLFLLQVRLVAVSKLKPVNDILALHQEPASQTHFGENYAQELTQKAELLPRSIRWHFIGGLQSGQSSSPPFANLESRNS
jgi:PLP dependent protein